VLPLLRDTPNLSNSIIDQRVVMLKIVTQSKTLKRRPDFARRSLFSEELYQNVATKLLTEILVHGVRMFSPRLKMLFVYSEFRRVRLDVGRVFVK
jgi:uncharacterized protein (DUF111 family)